VALRSRNGALIDVLRRIADGGAVPGMDEGLDPPSTIIVRTVLQRLGIDKVG
jgi:hypothetical protein